MKVPALTAVTQEAFINEVVNSVLSGYGMVPFVGSGASAASGILMGQEFTEYLTFCIWKSLHLDKPKRLNVAVQGWPSSPSRDDVSEAITWTKEVYRTICKRYHVEAVFAEGFNDKLKFLKMIGDRYAGADHMVSAMQRPLVPAILFKPGHTEANEEQVKDYHRAVASDPARQLEPMTPNASPTSRQYIEEAAIRSLHDWRAMLHFVSRLQYHPHLDYPVLGEANQALVDSFNSHITHGRRPNFTHTMLGHLAVRWRTQIFLTTNFDSLIEDALRPLGENFEVVPVSLRDPLPHPDTVHAQKCVIKLHGSRTETRADYSLDEMPTDEDRKRFFHYVRGRFPESPKGQGFLPSNLFVCGYSARDLRCVQLIKHLLDNDAKTKIFWICFAKEDIDWLSTLFAEHYSNHFSIIRSDRPDLLLYDIYQKLTLCLPRGGVSYQFAEDAPPEPFHNKSRLIEPKNELEAAGIEKIRQALFNAPVKNGHEKQQRPVVTVEGKIGVTNPLRKVFLEKTAAGAMQGVWLELEDFASVPHVAHELLQIIALRRGRYQLDHANFPFESRQTLTSLRDGDAKYTVESEWKSQWTMLMREWAVEEKYWLVVFHGRNGAGACAGWWDEVWGGKIGPNRDSPVDARVQAYKLLHDFMDMLAQLGFQVVYAPYTPARWEQEQKAQSWFDNELSTMEPDTPSTEGINSEMSPLRRSRAKPEMPSAVEDELEVKRFFAEPSYSFHGAVHDEKHPHGSIDLDLAQAIEADIAKMAKSNKPGGRAWTRKVIECGEYDVRNFESIIQDLLPKWMSSQRSESNASDPETLRRSPEGRRRFLYAFSLFRQARHFSALLSEAMNDCPCPFNIVGIDNDWLREQVLQAWLKELGGIGFLFLKPGGYVWIHRDIRLAIQTIAERGEEYKVVSPATYPFQRRATNHFWIAHWYGRAFNTTGHAQPFMEALYHLFQCIRCSPFSKSNELTQPSQIEEYRKGHIRVSLNWIIKLLRMGQRSMEFWVQAPMAECWFGSLVVSRLVDEISEAYYACEDEPNPAAKRKKQKHPLKTALDLLQIEMAAIYALLNNKPVYDFPHYVQFTHSGMERVATDFSQEEVPQVIDSSALGGKGSVKSHNAWLKNISNQLHKTLGNNGERAMLEALIGKVLPESRDKKSIEAKFREWRLEHWKWGITNESKDLDSDVGPLAVTECLTELAYGYVRFSKLFEHVRYDSEAGTLMLPRNPKAAKYWVRASALCRAALQLGPHVHPNCLHAELLQRVKALTLYGMCLGRLGRFFEAHRRLNEANALLSKSDFARDPLQMAIIKIRRAEVHILEARLLGELWDHLQAHPKDLTLPGLGMDPATVLQWQNIYVGVGRDGKSETDDERHKRGGRRLLRLHYAKLDEAQATLECAESFLGGQTHASLWWTRLWALNMRVLADHHPMWLHKESPQFDGLEPAVRTLAFRQRKNRVQQVEELFRKALTCSTSDANFKYWVTRQLDYFIRAFATAWLVDHDPASKLGDLPEPADFSERLSEVIVSSLKGLKKSQMKWFSGYKNEDENIQQSLSFEGYRDRIMRGDVSLYRFPAPLNGDTQTKSFMSKHIAKAMELVRDALSLP